MSAERVSWSELTACSCRRSDRKRLMWNMRLSYLFLHSCISQTKDAVLVSPLSSVGILVLKETRVGGDHCLHVSVFAVVRRLAGS